MKTNVAVFFGGRSVEHEISVISALQAINAFDKSKYNIIPVYISKQGRWYTGPLTLDIRNYKDMNSLVAQSEEVYMRPEYGDFNLYRANPGVDSSRRRILYMKSFMWLSLCFTGRMERTVCLRGCLKRSEFLSRDATRCRAPTAWTRSP